VSPSISGRATNVDMTADNGVAGDPDEATDLGGPDESGVAAERCLRSASPSVDGALRLAPCACSFGLAVLRRTAPRKP